MWSSEVLNVEGDKALEHFNKVNLPWWKSFEVREDFFFFLNSVLHFKQESIEGSPVTCTPQDVRLKDHKSLSDPITQELIPRRSFL